MIEMSVDHQLESWLAALNKMERTNIWMKEWKWDFLKIQINIKKIKKIFKIIQKIIIQILKNFKKINKITQPKFKNINLSIIKIIIFNLII